jgi:O-antigen ligase
LGKNFITSKSLSINENIIEQLSKIRIFNDQTSSGRIDIWENSLKIYQKDKLFGYGPQGDRFLLKNSDIKEQFFTNSSNALIYSLLSGGYFGISVMLLIYLNIIFKVYICLKKLKIFNDFNKITLKLSICYTIFFLIRSLFENSFSVFSIDFMIFILSATYIENYLKTSGYKFKVLK